MAWKRICCAIDLSNPSHLAMREAASLANELGADLTLLHVYESPTGASTGIIVSPPELFDAAARDVERKLEKWRVEAEQLAGRTVQLTIVPGGAAAEIVRFAAEQRMDAIVIATRARTGIQHLLLGSVAERVVTQADCPVVVVHRSRRTNV